MQFDLVPSSNGKCSFHSSLLSMENNERFLFESGRGKNILDTVQFYQFWKNKNQFLKNLKIKGKINFPFSDWPIGRLMRIKESLKISVWIELMLLMPRRIFLMFWAQPLIGRYSATGYLIGWEHRFENPSKKYKQMIINGVAESGEPVQKSSGPGLYGLSGPSFRTVMNCPVRRTRVRGMISNFSSASRPCPEDDLGLGPSEDQPLRPTAP